MSSLYLDMYWKTRHCLKKILRGEWFKSYNMDNILSLILVSATKT